MNLFDGVREKRERGGSAIPVFSFIWDLSHPISVMSRAKVYLQNLTLPAPSFLYNPSFTLFFSPLPLMCHPHVTALRYLLIPNVLFVFPPLLSQSALHFLLLTSIFPPKVYLWNGVVIYGN